MMSWQRAVASVIVLPVLTWRPPRMNIEAIEIRTPARTPMAMITSTRLKPRSAFLSAACLLVMVIAPVFIRTWNRPIGSSRSA